MELKVLWGDWLAQPAEHRALYLAVSGYRRRMDAFDEGERAAKRARDERASAAKRGRR